MRKITKSAFIDSALHDAYIHSAVEWSERSGVHQQTIYRIIRDGKKPLLQTALNLVDCLNLNQLTKIEFLQSLNELSDSRSNDNGNSTNDSGDL
jgi:DNA-binding phage protein